MWNLTWYGPSKPVIRIWLKIPNYSLFFRYHWTSSRKWTKSQTFQNCYGGSCRTLIQIKFSSTGLWMMIRVWHKINCHFTSSICQKYHFKQTIIKTKLKSQIKISLTAFRYLGKITKYKIDVTTHNFHI